MIYSEDLGEKNYSNVNLHCCLNIYRRPEKGLNSKPNYDIKDITILRQDRKGYDKLVNWDIRMVYWGSGCAGRILSSTDKKFAGEYKIIINNDLLRDRIKQVIIDTDWRGELAKIAMTRIKQYQIYEILKRDIPEFK